MGDQNAKQGRWRGRNSDKDRLRQRVWAQLEEKHAAIGSPYSAIPNFTGAQQAADRLAGHPAWQSSELVKSNPDRGQAWVRLRALQEGKRVYTPVPELVADTPFVLLDPVDLKRRGITLEQVMYSDGFLQHGLPMRFEDMEPMDIAVVGCVAVTRAGGRTGKGAGFADLELGIFQELNLLKDNTLLVTTVHDLQLVEDEEVLMQPHDYPLDGIFTPTQSIETRTRFPKPTGVDWSAVQPDQFDNIPFLTDLRQRLQLA